METPPEAELTRLLHDWSNGHPQALSRLVEMIYPELHKIAAIHLSRERSGHTLQPTALVHEAYLRLAQQGAGRQWTDRTHFFAVAARIVRSVLVDHARARHAGKRGAGSIRVQLVESMIPAAAQPLDLLDLDAALTALQQIDPLPSRAASSSSATSRGSRLTRPQRCSASRLRR